MAATFLAREKPDARLARLLDADHLAVVEHVAAKAQGDAAAAGVDRRNLEAWTAARCTRRCRRGRVRLLRWIGGARAVVAHVGDAVPIAVRFSRRNEPAGDIGVLRARFFFIDDAALAHATGTEAHPRCERDVDLHRLRAQVDEA